MTARKTKRPSPPPKAGRARKRSRPAPSPAKQAARPKAAAKRAAAVTASKAQLAPPRPRDGVRVHSWNVNGIRSVVSKGFLDWLGAHGGDIVGLQEVRAGADDIPAQLHALDDYHQHYVSASRKGYSGVGLLARRKPDAIETSLGGAHFDDEGRLQLARFGRLVVANGYFPNGSGSDRSNDRVPYKLDWYRALFDKIEALRRDGLRVLVMGDFNTAHKEIDLARPKENRKTSGFLVEECEELDRWIAAGWIDTFRAFEPGPGHYSWWSQRFGVRAKNIGWRIDYVLASPEAMPFVRRAFIEPHVLGSDHCPIGVDLDPAIFD